MPLDFLSLANVEFSFSGSNQNIKTSWNSNDSHMRHAMFLFQIILSEDNIIYETRTRSGHVYQIQIAPIFLSSALNIIILNSQLLLCIL